MTVWKRFKEIQQLQKDLTRKAREFKVKTGSMPVLPVQWFSRFKPEVIEERKEFILNFLNWVGDHPVLFRSEDFVKFFNNSEHSNTNSVESIDEQEIPDTSDALEVIASRLGGGGGEDPEVNKLLEQITEEAKLDERLEEIQNEAIESRLRRLQEDSPIDYLYEAALKFTEAVEAEANGKYETAFDSYKTGIDILLTGGKNDTDPQRKKIVKEKVAKYLARAEDIFENFVQNQEANDFLLLSGKTDEQSSFEHLTVNFERPLNYLSRFKVIKVLDGLQQVQDVTDKKVYMLKVIPKPPSMHASRLIYLPQEANFMVPLVTYCQSSDSIFLLLKLVSGGKLWSYIQNYAPQPEAKRSSLGDIFVETPKPKLKPAKARIPLPISIPEVSHPTTDDDDPPSVEMEIPDLLQCSQKLLHSVSSTLKRSKVETEVDDDSIDDGSIDEILREIESTKNSDTLESIPSAAKHELYVSLEFQEIGFKPRHKLLPETTVIGYCAELVVAVDSLHSQGIVCGDLNMDNLLLGPRGQLVLTYFHRNEIRLKAPQEKAAEEGYVAPERPLTRKSDWWSVGIVMYELLTERRFCEIHPGHFMRDFVEIQYPEGMEISDDAKELLEHVSFVFYNFKFYYLLIFSWLNPMRQQGMMRR